MDCKGDDVAVSVLRREAVATGVEQELAVKQPVEVAEIETSFEAVVKPDELSEALSTALALIDVVTELLAQAAPDEDAEEVGAREDV